jgi:protein-tyrosine phosphatase
MDIFTIDEKGNLSISPDLDEWQPIEDRHITVVFDLDDDLDLNVPEIPDQLVYLYFPFEDKEGLPNMEKLHALARLAATMIAQGDRVLVHCGMGHNRSALLAGIILTYLGMSGEEAVTLIREKRRGALYNKTFAAYLMGLPRAPVQGSPGVV